MPKIMSPLLFGPEKTPVDGTRLFEVTGGDVSLVEVAPGAGLSDDSPLLTDFTHLRALVPVV